MAVCTRAPLRGRRRGPCPLPPLQALAARRRAEESAARAAKAVAKERRKKFFGRGEDKGETDAAEAGKKDGEEGEGAGGDEDEDLPAPLPESLLEDAEREEEEEEAAREAVDARIRERRLVSEHLRRLKAQPPKRKELRKGPVVVRVLSDPDALATLQAKKRAQDFLRAKMLGGKRRSSAMLKTRPKVAGRR